MALPIFQTTDRDLSMLQTRWASEINPYITAPIAQGHVLQGVALAMGDTVINHKLGRKLQGWYLVDANGAASVYRSAEKNASTLTLNSSAAIICDIYVF